MYLVSAYFDETSNKILEDYIKKVALASGNDFYIANKVPAHLTLLALEARTVEELIPNFEKLTLQDNTKLKSGEISIVTVGQLMPRVLYLAPFINEYLFDLQARVYEAFKDLPEVKISSYYKPYSWLPHITIGKTLTSEQMLRGVEVLEDFRSLNGKIVKIGLAKVNPHEDVRSVNLFI